MNEPFIEFNINDYVWVKLTDVGRKLLKEQHEKLNKLMESYGGGPYPSYRPPIEIDGWSKWQMWDLFQRLGKHLQMGFDLPFEGNIRLEDLRDK